MEGYQRLYTLDTVAEEFDREVIGNDRSNAKRYLIWLDKCMADLDTYGERAILLQRFEKIGGSDVIYSMRYPNSRKNPRVLYFFICEGTPVLLYAFLEKKKADYTHGIKVAETRAKFVKANWSQEEGIK